MLERILEYPLNIFDVKHKPKSKFKMEDNKDQKTESSTKFNINTALLIFLVIQAMGAIWWASGLTSDMRNLNNNITARDNDTQKRMDKFDDKLVELNRIIIDKTKEIQTLREMYFLEFGKRNIKLERNN